MKAFGIVATLVLMAGGAGSAAWAQEAEAPAVQAPDQAAQQEKKICRSQKMTGSLTRVRRTCLTRAEWDRLAEGTRRNVNSLERDANQTESLRRGDAMGAGAVGG